MFTLAQYVFGIGKPEITDGQVNHCGEPNEDTEQCLLTNVENDWIIIDLADSNSNVIKKVKTNPKTKKSLKVKLQSQPNSSCSEEESWSVEPPECFKNASPEGLNGVKTSSLENLLIEHPSMSVFDNLFVKNTPKKSEQQKIKVNSSQKLLKTTKSENLKENVPTTRPNKKKQTAVNHVNALPVTNNNTDAITAVLKEKVNKNISFNKKSYQRQNKVAVQRNGPIIRHKKMFTHLNGVYHNRNHC